MPAPILGVVLESLGLPLRQALPAASRLGVQSVQFDAVGELAPDKLGDTARRELRTLLRGFDLQLAAIGCPLRHGLDTFDDQQPRLDRIRAAMQLAYDLGARTATMPLPAIPIDEPTPAEGATPAPISYLTYNAAPPKGVTLRESLLALGQHGDRIGVTVALEGGLDDGATLAGYLGGFASGSLRVAFDPANFLLNGHEPLTSLASLRGLVDLAHARDARAARSAAGAIEVAVGAGDVEWLGLLGSLEAIGFAGSLLVERTTGADRPGDVAAGVKFLRRYVPRGA